MRKLFGRKNYEPPEMPPFPASLDEVHDAIAPYMAQKRPLDFFFEFYVMEVIGQLPPETIAALDSFSNEYPDIFETGDWRSEVRSGFELSDTIDIAILDLWYRNSEIALQRGTVYHPWHYAINFADNYFADGSQVDVWPGDALEAAKERIAAHRG